MTCMSLEQIVVRINIRCLLLGITKTRNKRAKHDTKGSKRASKQFHDRDLLVVDGDESLSNDFVHGLFEFKGQKSEA